MGLPHTEILLSDLQLPECPRWLDGKLWFSDMFAKRVMTVDMRGNAKVIAEFDDKTAGLGFLPDKTPIVVLANKQHLVRLDGKSHEVHADLNRLGANHLNDMIIDGKGRAYVGLRMVRPSNAPFDPVKEAIDGIIIVDPQGNATVATRGLITSNGMALTGDGQTLIIAETRAARLTSFTVNADGSLQDPQLFANLPKGMPDGMCVDAEGAVWVAALTANAFIRIARGGEVLQTVDIQDRIAMACTLGGPDRRTLFMMTVKGNLPQLISESKSQGGFVETIQVDVPGAGYP